MVAMSTSLVLQVLLITTVTIRPPFVWNWSRKASTLVAAAAAVSSTAPTTRSATSDAADEYFDEDEEEEEEGDHRLSAAATAVGMLRTIVDGEIETETHSDVEETFICCIKSLVLD